MWTLEKEDHNCAPLKCGLCQVTSFLRVQCGRGEEKRAVFQWSGLISATSSRRSSSTPQVINHVDSRYLWYGVLKMVLTFVVFLPKPHNPSVRIRKTFKKPQLRNILQNTSSVSSDLSRSSKPGTYDKAVMVKRGLWRRWQTSYQVVVNGDGTVEQMKGVESKESSAITVDPDWFSHWKYISH